MTKVSWINNEHEGKALRKVFNHLMRRFKKASETDDYDDEKLGKLAHTITIVAKTKAELSKIEGIDKQLNQVMQLIDDYRLKRILPGVVEDAKQLPGPSD